MQELRRLLEQIQTLANDLDRVSFREGEDSPLLPASRSILKSLEAEGPRTVPVLAYGRASSRQNIQILVNRLERMGFVESRPNPAHEKSVLIRITKRGSAALKQSEQDELDLFEKLSAELTVEQIQSGLEIVQRLRDAIPKRPSRRIASKQKQVLVPSPTEAEQDQIALEDETLPYNLL